MRTKNVISHKIYDFTLNGFLVGFDINDSGESEYRWNELISVLSNNLVDFAFGEHNGKSTRNSELLPKLKDAANSIYKISHFEEVNNIYLNGKCIEDDVEDKYLRRGEFGELILHLLLKDFMKTIPLISKIYFKDSVGSTVHGFDAVHIDKKNKSLWLGESKLYKDAKIGIKALIKDIKDHFNKDYLQSEFAIISKKCTLAKNKSETDYWINLMQNSRKLSDQLNSISIPLLCTYTSNNFIDFDDENCSDFLNAYNKEVNNLKKYFEDNNDHPLKTKLNIILILFPVRDKTELVGRLHKNLRTIQSIV